MSDADFRRSVTESLLVTLGTNLDRSQLPRELTAFEIEAFFTFTAPEREVFVISSLKSILEIHQHVEQYRWVACGNIARRRSHRREIARSRDRERVIAIQVRAERRW